MGLEDIGVRMVVQGQREFENALDKSNSSIANIAKVALGIGAAGITALTSVITASITKTFEWGQTLDDIGDVLGTTAEQSAGLASMFRTIGGDSGQLTQAMAIMSKGLENAKGELGPTGTALKSLGINFKDASGRMLPATDLFQLIADKLGPMPEGMEKTALMMDIFGKSGKEMGDALNAAAKGGVQKYIDQAKEMGLAIDPEQIVKAKMGFETIGLGLQGMAVRIGMVFLPLIQKVLPSVIKWVSKAGDFLGKVFGALTEEGGGLGKAFDVIKTSLAGMVPQWVIDTLSTLFDFISGIVGYLQQQGISTIGDFFYALANGFLNISGGSGIFQAIGEVLMWFGDVVDTVFKAVFDWLSVNLPIAIQTVSDFWNNVLWPTLQTVFGWIQANVFPILSSVFSWLQSNIPTAIQTVTDFWNNTLWPVLQTVFGWIQTNVFPILQTVWNWLQVNVPAAIQTVTNYWNNVLLPAITDVWSFITTYLVPIFNEIVNVINGALTLAITALQGLWEKVLLPAITSVWEFIQKNILPIFQSVADFINKTLGPAFQWLKDNVLDPVTKAFGHIKEAAQWVIDRLKELSETISKIKLPDWLTPGSPTPFEMGLRGISDAMNDLNTVSLPNFSAGLKVVHSIAGMPGTGVSAGPSNYNYSTAYNLSVMTSQSPQLVQRSFAMMKLLAG